MELKSVHQKVNSIALKTPDKVAVQWGKDQVTYNELEERSNQIAHFFKNREKKVTNIPVLLGNSIALIETILGIMKAGSIFAPIDPELPEDRIKMMLGQIDADWVVVHPDWLSKLDQMMATENRNLNVLVVEEWEEVEYNNIKVFKIEPKIYNNCPTYNEVLNKHCYIYFTSGSTGTPKAILGRHRSLKHFIDWEIKEFKVDESFRVSNLIAPSFDPFLRDIFVPLCAGATLYIPENRDIILYPDRLIKWIDENEITLIHIVPTVFKSMVSGLDNNCYFDKLKYILLAGEKLRGNDIKKFIELYDDEVELVNLYGPTETTLAKVFHRIETSDVDKTSVPVGKPIPGAQVMILNEDMESCVKGTIGEIYIRTPYITSGYYNNVELAKKVFIRNPFSNNSRDIIYKTGDLGRINGNGDLEILGRVDHQIKLRGMRVELGEIESHLLDFDQIDEAVVTAKEDDNNNQYLCAYLISETTLEPDQLKVKLLDILPDYMIPSYFIQLDEIPLNQNGKVDWKALPEPELGIGVEYVPPETPIEESLVKIWSEVLGVKEIGILHNFFDLGGHSLKAALVGTQIHKELNVDVTLKEMFVNPTIKQLAACIEQVDEETYASIEPVEEKEYYPVSSAQRRVYVLNQLEQVSTSYNLPRVIKVNGGLNQPRFEEAINKLLDRHETLRTSFHSIEGEIVQKVHHNIDFKISHLKSEEDEISKVVQDFIQPFNLAKAPLIRVGLITISETEHVLLFDTHHIVSDGTSMDILVRDFVNIYHGEEMPELTVQYKDFAEWQNELVETGVMEKQEEFWLETFSGTIPVLDMPTDYPRPSIQSFEGSKYSFEIDSQLTEELKELARKNGTTLFMVFLASYNILLSKYSGQEDVVVGSPIAGRSHVDIQNVIGMFINTLAMRNYPESDKTFKEFLNEVRQNALAAYENQDYQFEKLVKELDIPRDLSRNPLFDTMFILHNYEHAELAMDDLDIEAYPFENEMTKLDMTFHADELEDRFGFVIEYCTKLFKEETIDRLAKHYVTILRQVITNPELKLQEIKIITPEEEKKVMVDFNDTLVDYPKEKTIHQLFEEQVNRTPDNTALVFGKQELTYQQLNVGANQIARRLREKGVTPDTIVGIMTVRSMAMIVGMLGVLKSGAAYLPIDPAYPTKRVEYVLEDSQVDIVLTDKRSDNPLLAMDVDLIHLDQEESYQGEETNLEPINGPENMAYIIYTSGSTGKPKGVMIEHRSVNNFITGITDLINFGSANSILALTTISFDIFGLESLLPLTQGTRVVIANEEQQKDTKILSTVITRNNVDTLQMTPSRMQMLLNDEESSSCLADVKTIMLGGEALPQPLLEAVRSVTDARIYNMYGPTETTIWSSVKELTDSEQVTIGKPIANTGIYILDESNQVQPIGVPGELCITGDGLARGYWQRQELTEEKFIPNPLQDIKDIDVIGERMYRTGDLARWLPNGEIDFAGRIDQQVKIRGYRIEPGEIENELIKFDGVKEVAIVARDDNNGSKNLCAYIVSENEFNVQDIKGFLGKELPAYMIPTYFIPIEELPYTPNGKLNRKALPEPDADIVSGVEYIPPSTEIEEKLIKIWEEVLGIEGIGVKHNFFDVGGNSINIIKVINLISDRMGIQVPMSELFIRPTISEIANNMFMENPMDGFECIIQLNKPTPGKKNIFILHTWEGIVYQYKEIAKKLEGEYNVYGIQAKGILRPAKLPETLEEMITEYIVEMKAIQPEGPYTIVGYCYGNWIAYKMVEMLEDQDVTVDRMIQIDENAYLPDKARELCAKRAQLTRPYRGIRKYVRKYITRRYSNPMDYYPTLEEYRKANPPAEGPINNERTVRENVDYLCTKGYTLRRLIYVDTYVIKAEENNLQRYTKEDWEKQVYGKVWFTEIPGGHETIFNPPYVEELTNQIRIALED